MRVLAYVVALFAKAGRTARVEVLLKRKLADNKRLAWESVGLSNKNTELSLEIESLKQAIRLRDAEIEVLKLHVQQLAMVVTRDRERVAAEAAIATASLAQHKA